MQHTPRKLLVLLLALIVSVLLVLASVDTTPSQPPWVSMDNVPPTSATSRRENAVEIWQSNVPARPYREIARQEVIVGESILGGDSLQRSIAKRVRLAKGDAAIILSSTNRTESRQTEQYTYQAVTREAHVAIIRYL